MTTRLRRQNMLTLKDIMQTVNYLSKGLSFHFKNIPYNNKNVPGKLRFETPFTYKTACVVSLKLTLFMEFY